ncbi:MAG: H-X9-DG-CTERM domain-containing protein [Armatimonadota bacterium]
MPSRYGYTIRDTISANNWYARPNPRHNEGANISFCDGHAKWFTMSFLMSDEAGPLWYMDNENHLP